MPLLETKGAGSAQGFGLSLGSAERVYIEDVFSTYLYTGNNSGGATPIQTINNGIDLAGEGGMVWSKARSASGGGNVWDTKRGVRKYLETYNTSAESTSAVGSGLTTFNSDGFTLGTTWNTENFNGYTYASWTFRKQPKFFDVQTFTTTGTGGTQTLSHDLGAVPGFILLKKTSATGNWWAIHRSVTQYSPNWWQNAGVLEGTGAFFQGDLLTAEPTSTQIALGPTFTNSGNEGTYVAYLFAHNAGGFGLTGTDNVISCGSYTGNGSATGPVIDLGWEPQFLMFKRTSGGTANWMVVDSMRGLNVTGRTELIPNLSNAEFNSTGSTIVEPTSTGFKLTANTTQTNSSGSDYIYIAIRRGPMKVPTSGTEVFEPLTYTGNGTSDRFISASLTPDLVIGANRTTTYKGHTVDRLRGRSALVTNTTAAEQTPYDGLNLVTRSGGLVLDASTGGSTGYNISANTYVNWAFKRAPGFFDEVCYTGTGVARTVAHNLAAVPELMIVRKRDAAGFWRVYHKGLNGGINPEQYGINLNEDTAEYDLDTLWNDTAPTSSVFSLGTQGNVNSAGSTYVSYLFATLAGVSKVGSYTGTGTTQVIDCGFTAGARFVLIKRTDSTGDWYVWDSARGIVSGNDPYLLLNSTAAEVTNTDYVDTASTGFEISSTAPAAINANGGSFIFLAIA